MFNIRRIILLTMLILLFTSSIAYCNAEDYGSLRKAINNNSAFNYLSGSGKNSFMVVLRDVFNIVRVIAGVTLITKIFGLYIDFRGAAENPGLQAQIKSKAMWLSLGLIFLMNFWNIYSFLANVF